MILTHGILRARYRTSFTVPELLEPDAIYQIRYVRSIRKASRSLIVAN